MAQPPLHAAIPARGERGGRGRSCAASTNEAGGTAPWPTVGTAPKESEGKHGTKNEKEKDASDSFKTCWTKEIAQNVDCKMHETRRKRSLGTLRMRVSVKTRV